MLKPVLMFSRKGWSLQLKDGEPAFIPVPDGHAFGINNIQASTTDSSKIIVEAIVQTIRLDRLADDDDVAQSDINDDVTVAVLFPKQDPNVRVNLSFSEVNTCSLRATGGDVTVTGAYDDADGLDMLGTLND